MTFRDAELKTTDKRITWFCDHFNVDRPDIEYDPDEPDEILLTDNLLAWTRREGVSLDWLICGSVGGMAATFRDKYRTDPEAQKAVQTIGMATPNEAYNDTDHMLYQVTTLLDALYDMAMDTTAIAHSKPEAMRIMALLEVTREKARATMEAHEAAWETLKEHRNKAA